MSGIDPFIRAFAAMDDGTIDINAMKASVQKKFLKDTRKH